MLTTSGSQVYWRHDPEFFTWGDEEYTEQLREDVNNWGFLAEHGWDGKGSKLDCTEAHCVEEVFWMGAAGATTALHYDDNPMAVLHQFAGQKIVTLVPPELSHLMYPALDCPPYESGTTFSRVAQNNRSWVHGVGSSYE